MGIADTTNIDDSLNISLDLTEDQSVASNVGDAVSGDVIQEQVVDVAVGAVSGGVVTLEVLEPGAVAQAIELSETAVQTAAGIAAESSGVAGEAIKGVLDLAKTKTETGAQTATRFGLWIAGIITIGFIGFQFLPALFKKKKEKAT